MARQPVGFCAVHCILFLFIFVCALVIPASADDWPELRGPDRTGVSAEQDLPETWSLDGENLLWRVPYGGLSGPVVLGDRVYLQNSVGEGASIQERILALDANTGDLVWEDRFNITHSDAPAHRAGWATPALDPETGNVYILTADATFVAYSRDGDPVWRHQLTEEFGFLTTHGGRVTSPMIDGDLVIAAGITFNWGELAGGGQRFMAFDKRTGQNVWVSSPGQRPFDTTYSPPMITEIDGVRLIIAGGSDGAWYAIRASTGERVWRYAVSKRGLNTGAIRVGDDLILSHSEENLDQGTMGRVVAIDAALTGDVTETAEKWRLNEAAIGFSSPLIRDGVLYVIDNSANLLAIDADRGEILWEHSVGTVGKSSPVWADGKLYVTETNGNVHILRANADGVTVLDSEELEVEDGRSAEIYGSFAPAYGRLYLTAESGIYAIGDPTTPYRATAGTTSLNGEANPGGVASLQVVPADLILTAGDTASFRVRALDANGQFLGEREASWAIDGLVGATVSGDGTLSTSASASTQGGKVVATVDGLSASGQVRVYEPLPWSENFESGRPPFWIGGGPRVSAAEVDGEQVLKKSASPTGIHRHAIYMGPADMSGYTVQADLMASEWRRRRPDLGVINSGYTLDLRGNLQRVQLQSWAAELRIDERTEFEWVAGVWYSLKLRVDIEGDRAIVRGKVWPRSESEPTAWTVTAEDPEPVREGAPGLIGYSPIDIYIDNVRVVENQ